MLNASGALNYAYAVNFRAYTALSFTLANQLTAGNEVIIATITNYNIRPSRNTIRGLVYKTDGTVVGSITARTSDGRFIITALTDIAPSDSLSFNFIGM